MRSLRMMASSKFIPPRMNATAFCRRRLPDRWRGRRDDVSELDRSPCDSRGCWWMQGCRCDRRNLDSRRSAGGLRPDTRPDVVGVDLGDVPSPRQSSPPSRASRSAPVRCRELLPHSGPACFCMLAPIGRWLRRARERVSAAPTETIAWAIRPSADSSLGHGRAPWWRRRHVALEWSFRSDSGRPARAPHEDPRLL